MLSLAKHRFILVQILKDIYSDPEISSLLGFKGGTAAYLFYNLPRFSVDLDFNLLDIGKKDIVVKKVNKILQNYGTIKEKRDKRFTLFFVISYARKAHNIKIEISKKIFPSDWEIKNYLGIPMLVMKKKDMIIDYRLRNILVFDAIPRDAVRYIQTRANVLISAYSDSEFLKYNLPNKIFDYHGAGRPIILAGKGDAAELVRNAGSGIVVPPEMPEEVAKAVQYVYEHQSEAEEMGKRGKSYVSENLDKRKIFGSLLKSIEALNTISSDNVCPRACHHKASRA